jgi:hypothetical protein
MTRLAAPLFLGVAAAALTLACSSSEAPAEDHNPVAFDIDGVVTDTSDTVVFAAGTNDTVVLTFFNAANDNLNDVEAEHFSTMTFTPPDSITATRLSAHHFQQHLVIGNVAGQVGDLDIGFGHDTLADEHSFSLHYKIQ